MTLANQQQKPGVLHGTAQPCPALPGLAQSDPTQTDQTFCTHPDHRPGQAIFYVFQICTGISLSLSHRQVIRHQWDHGTILNTPRWWDEIVVLQIFTRPSWGEVRETNWPELPTWPQLPAAGGSGDTGGQAGCWYFLTYFSRYSSGFCLLPRTDSNGKYCCGSLSLTKTQVSP